MRNHAALPIFFSVDANAVGAAPAFALPKNASIVFRRYFAAGRRVRPLPVAAGLCVFDDRVLRPSPCRERARVVHLVLQRGEERLRHGVVAARAGPPDRQPDLMLGRPLSEQPGRVLGAAIRVEYRVPGHVAARPGRFQGVDGGVGGHAARQRPSRDHPRAQADGRGRVRPAPAGAQAGYAAHGPAGGHGAREVAPHQAGPDGAPRRGRPCASSSRG